MTFEDKYNVFSIGMPSLYRVRGWIVKQLPHADTLGWSIIDGKLSPILMTIDPVPKACMEIISSQCLKGCGTMRCKCRKNTDTLKQVPKFRCSKGPKFRSSQVPGTASSQFSSSGNFKFRNSEIKVNKKRFFSISTKKHFRY